jgi:type II secretory pathway pseudopilin PulG
MKISSAMRRPKPGIRAFSLVEVVLALGICVFVLVTIMGLYSTGMRVNRESENQIQEADLASLIISSRRAAPTNSVPLAIPASALTGPFTNAYPNGQLTNYVGSDGMITNTANAVYLVSCRAGTNAMTGPNMAQVYLMLSWPAQANPAASSDHYEVTTYIPFP